MTRRIRTTEQAAYARKLAYPRSYQGIRNQMWATLCLSLGKTPEDTEAWLDKKQGEVRK